MVTEDKWKQLKIEILKLLMNKNLSEEEITDTLRINTTLTRRLISSLKDDGFFIKKTNGKLNLELNRIYIHELQNKLRTKILGKRVMFFSKVKTTMDIARQNSVYEGLVVIAERQERGRGRMGKIWFSPEGGIWLSVVLKPKTPPEYTSLIGIFSSISVSNAIREIAGLENKIRWPNDIIIRNKKVAGILVEGIYEGTEITSAIVGIGINNNIKVCSFPEEINKELTTLLHEKGYPLPPVPLISSILENLEKYYILFKKHKYSKIIEDWRQKSSILGKRVMISTNKGIIYGTVLNIDKSGRLILQLNNNEKIKINTGMVLQLREI